MSIRARWTGSLINKVYHHRIFLILYYLSCRVNPKYNQIAGNYAKCFYSNLLGVCPMAEGKVNSLFGNKVALLAILAVVAGLAMISLPSSALAYTVDDPAVKYHCFQTNEDGSYMFATDDEGASTDQLVPCEINAGDNAWMLTSSALVLMMTPAGLAIFYGGLARQKNSVNTLHMVFITTGVIAIQYVLWGYSLAFGPDAGGYGVI